MAALEEILHRCLGVGELSVEGEVHAPPQLDENAGEVLGAGHRRCSAGRRVRSSAAGSGTGALAVPSPIPGSAHSAVM